MMLKAQYGEKEGDIPRETGGWIEWSNQLKNLLY